jgi:hypothetical protein
VSNIPPNMVVLTKFQVGIYLSEMWIAGALAGVGIGYLWGTP